MERIYHNFCINYSSIWQHQPTIWAVLPWDCVPEQHLASCQLDETTMHRSMAIGTGRRLHRMVYYFNI